VTIASYAYDFILSNYILHSDKPIAENRFDETKDRVFSPTFCTLKCMQD